MNNILEFFIREPEREFHLRGLAKLAKKSPTTVSKYLELLRKEGLLKSKRKLNHLLFKANTENPLFRETKLCYNLKTLRNSGIIEYLNEEFNEPEAVILFGSYAKAQDTPASDIDILVVTTIKKDVGLKKFEKLLGHPIQLFLHSNSEIDKMKTKNKELLNSWVNGIVVSGYWELFR